MNTLYNYQIMDLLPDDIIYMLFKHSDIWNAYKLSLINKRTTTIFTSNESLWNHYLTNVIDKSIIEIIWITNWKMTYKKYNGFNKLNSTFGLNYGMDKLINLQTLYLSNDQIASIPSEIDQLKILLRNTIIYH